MLFTSFKSDSNIIISICLLKIRDTGLISSQLLRVQILKVQKAALLDSLFALLGSAHAKAAYKMMVKSTQTLSTIFHYISPDYDTNKTVQCSSAFVYDKSRQRSLQHFIEFEELPEKNQNIVLPSGKIPFLQSQV